MMPTFPRSPLRFRKAGFPRYGSKAGLSDGPSLITLRLSWLPACPSREAGLLPSFVLPAANMGPPLCVGGPPARWNTAMRATCVALLQGPSLRSRLCCPGPSTLIRPHPPHSRAHPSFIALRLIWNAFTVAGALRQLASGSGLSLLRSVLTCRPLRPRGVRHP